MTRAIPHVYQIFFFKSSQVKHSLFGHKYIVFLILTHKQSNGGTRRALQLHIQIVMHERHITKLIKKKTHINIYINFLAFRSALQLLNTDISLIVLSSLFVFQLII